MPATSPTPWAGDPVSSFGAWVIDLPSRLWHLAELVVWPWLALLALAVALLAAAGWVVHARLWRRAVAEGHWVRITPPRVVSADPATVWRLLGTLARRAAGGWRLAKPPLAFEIHAHAGWLTAGLWLPKWVPLPVVAAEVARVWPGAVVEQTTPPSLQRAGEATVAGYRLASTVSDTEALVYDLHLTGRRRGAVSGDEPLHAVWAALREAHGPGLLQVLVRPAPARRVAGLRNAARHPTTPRRSGAALAAHGLAVGLRAAVRLLLDLVTELVTTGGSPRGHRHGGHRDHGGSPDRAPDPLEREQMRDAAAKLRHGPLLIAAVRIAATRPDRSWARGDARTNADGFAAVSGVLYPVRLRRAASVLAQRRVRRSQWLLVTPAELGTLAHLPADPARHGFDTAALHRPHPGGAGRPTPERRTRDTPGWTRTGWTPLPPDHHNRDDRDDRDGDPDHDPRPDPGPDDGWSIT